MTASASVNIRTSVAGVTISQTITRTEEVEALVSLDLPRGTAGELTTRTDDAAGVITLDAGHGIEAVDTVCVFWDGGSRYGVTVSGPTATTINISAGSGDNLPAQDTELVVTKEVEALVDITGDDIVVVAVKASRRASVQFRDAVDANIERFDMPEGEGRFHVEGIGTTNFLAGETVASIVAANGHALLDTDLQIGLLLDGTPP